MKEKRLTIFLIIFIVQIFIFKWNVSADQAPARPENFKANYPVYNTDTGENTVSLSWDASAGADFYILQISTDSNWAGQTITEEVRVVGQTYNDIRQNSVSNPITGTIFRYKLFAAAYIRDELGNLTPDYVISSTYATVTVLVDPAISATALSTSKIKLVWDDVQYNGDSINYEIQIYKNAVKVGQQQINADDIGNTVTRVNGKVEYIVSDLDRSTEYSFRLVPELDPGLIKFNPYVSVSGATNISAYLQRYNESIVKFIWDEYQGSVPSSDLYYKVIEITQQNNQKVYKVIAIPEVPYYFIQIRNDKEYSYLVEVRKKEGDKKIAQSAEVSLKDIIIPTTPETPKVEYTVGNNAITLLWDAAKTINGIRDTEMKYDVWLFTEPDYIDNVRKFYTSDNRGVIDNRIGTDLQIVNGNSSNPNYSLVQVNGQDKYQFFINNLLPNTNYYVGVVAKKIYLMQDSENPELIISLNYNSEPAIETVRTTSGYLDQPIALVEPQGVSIKTDAEGKALVTNNSVTIKWPLGKTINGNFVRFYDNNVYFKVGYEIYTPKFDKNKINDPNNPNYNIKEKDVNITIEEQEAFARINGLTANTLYVFWVKAYRDVQMPQVVTKVSEASDPIIVATLPDYTMPGVKPPVPVLTVIDNKYADKVILQFNSLAGIKYTIIWGTEDSISKQKNSKEYTALASLSPDSVTINGLEPETTYYFRIKATSNGISSEWSDSVIGITIPIPPPNVPRGFGIKRILQNGELIPDIGEHHISLQWDKEDDVSYIIEISKSDNFNDSEKIEVKNISEYKITTFKEKELPSNTRFWIRIFAKDTKTGKTSQSSPYLTVKTKFNYDEYDSNEENEVVIEEDIVKEVIDGTKGTWNVDMTGINADRIIEKIKKQRTPDCNLDIIYTSVSGINKREIIVPYKVIEMLSRTNQNFIIKCNNAEFVFLPDSLNLDVIKNIKQKPGQDIVIKITVQTISQNSNNIIDSYKLLSDINELNITAVAEEERQIVDFKRPIKIKLSYKNDISRGIVDSYYLAPNSSEWIKISSIKEQVNGTLYAILFNDKTGSYTVKKKLLDTGQLGAYVYKNEIEELLSTNKIKSVSIEDIRPTQPVTLEDAVKMLLDSVQYEYGGDFMDIAKKSGLLDNINDIQPTRNLSREEAISMVMRLYEIKTGQTLSYVPTLDNYYDGYKVGNDYVVYVSNAIKMRVLTPDNYIKPQDYMTRGEILVVIKRLLDIIEIY